MENNIKIEIIEELSTFANEWEQSIKRAFQIFKKYVNTTYEKFENFIYELDFDFEILNEIWETTYENVWDSEEVPYYMQTDTRIVPDEDLIYYYNLIFKNYV